MQPAVMDASVNQHYRATEPTIGLTVPTCAPTRPRKVTGETEVEMTVAEAEALRDRLSLILAMLNDGTSTRSAACPAWCVDHDVESGLHYGAPTTLQYLDRTCGGTVADTMDVQVLTEDGREAISIGGRTYCMDPAGALRLADALVKSVAKVRQR
jgi:hypothetical protein